MDAHKPQSNNHPSLGEQVRIAYLISAHKDPRQLARTVQALHTGNARFFIHVDANVDIKPFIAAFAPPHLSVYNLYNQTI